MADRNLATVFHHLSRRATEDAPDRELLERFLRRRDEAAFAALVQRHGGMVLGVCRRLLGHAQDAEDACQAVFLVLARKAGSIRRREALPGWLHGVACRVCRKLAGRARRQPRPEPVADTAADVPTEVTWREVRRVLDEELNRLPAGYRAPLVLCYLEGKTQDEAARELGWSLGTVRGRVERGRDLLRKRLTRRGVTLSGALLGALLAQHATAGPPQAALLDAAPARVLALAEGVIRTMNISKYVWAAVVGLTLVLLGTAAGAFLAGSPAGDPPALPPKEANKPMPPQRDAKLVADFRAHAATFQLTLSTHLRQRDGEKSRWLLLQVPKNVLPAGAADTVAQLSRAQAIQLIDALAKHGFFRRATPKVPPDRATSHLTMSAFVQKDGEGLHYWLTTDVDLPAERLLRALRACLDGRAAKELDVLLDGLAH